MTVSGEAPAVLTAAPLVDPDTIAQQFTELYDRYHDRLQRFVWLRLGVHQVQLAEDVTQEAFIDLWRKMSADGGLERPETVYGLLAVMARHQISRHFDRLSSGERALDFGDPVNTPMLAIGHTYAPDSPELASLSAELDEAMDSMAVASESWRGMHKKICKLRTFLASAAVDRFGGLLPATQERLEEKLAAAKTAEAETLVAFQRTCRRVGDLRSEMEAVAGPSWRSSVAVPATRVQSTKAAGNIIGDPSVTHCFAGHLMDRDNTHFQEDGTRCCRACVTIRHRRSAEKRQSVSTRTRPLNVTVETLEAARALLMDTERDTLTLEQIQQMIGLSGTTLRRLLPNELAARRVRRLRYLREHRPSRKADALEAARGMLLDAQCDLTVAEIAERCGIAGSTPYRRLAAEVASHSARRRSAVKPPSKAVEAARERLLDPRDTTPISAIAAAAGLSMPYLYRHLPDALAVRRARRKGGALVGAGTQ